MSGKQYYKNYTKCIKNNTFYSEIIFSFGDFIFLALEIIVFAISFFSVLRFPIRGAYAEGNCNAEKSEIAKTIIPSAKKLKSPKQKII